MHKISATVLSSGAFDTTKIPLLTARSCPSLGLFTCPYFSIYIPLDPPPSRFMALAAPANFIMSAICLVVAPSEYPP